MHDQKKSGVIISYINIMLEMLISIFFTPFLISSLGSGEYGLYRIVQSFAGQLSIMSFGICTLVTRNVVRYNTLNESKEKENFLALSAIVSVVLSFAVLLVGFILSFGIEGLFDKTFSVSELILAKKLYWILIFRIIITVLTDMYSGILCAHECFAIRNGLIMVRYALRVGLLIVMLKLGFGSVSIVMIDLMLAVVVYVVSMIYAHAVLKEKIKFYYLDKEEIKAALLFSSAIFLQAVINQVNQNMDSVILGAMTTTQVVTMYSIALNLFTVFNSATSVVGSVYVPKATKMIIGNASSDEITELVVKPGRIQMMAGCLIITGFALFGKEFIVFWVGREQTGAYAVALILMIPTLLPVIQNVANAVLDAMLKRMGRSIILGMMAVINVAVSIILVKHIGYFGAAIGTAGSYIIGNGILMNIYIAKVTPIKIGKMYKGLFDGILPVSLVCFALFIPVTHIIKVESLMLLIAKIVVYSLVYLAVMYVFAMRDYEKKLVMGVVKNILRRH